MSVSSQQNTTNVVPQSSSKRRLSLFSFGLTSSTLSKNSTKIDSATSPNTCTNRNKSSPSPNHPMTNPSTIKQHDSTANSINTQLDSPINSPDLENKNVFNNNPESNIFERSVQDFHFDHPQNRSNSFKLRNGHRGSSASLKSNQHIYPFPQIKNEDFIPPALDATTSILNNKDTNLDDVEVIYSNRRSSSVIGLNMALGKPFTPSRKNSTYSINQQLRDSTFDSPQIHQNQQPQSPVTPPKLTSSKSSVSFYSYADMINNDEFSRRPSFKQSYSQGIIPTTGRKQSISSNIGPSSPAVSTNSGSYFPKLHKPSKLSSSQLQPNQPNHQSQLSRQFSIREGKTLGSPPLSSSSQIPNSSNSTRPISMASTSSKLPINEPSSNNLNKFLISPESSDLEDHEVFYPALNTLSKRKSLSSSNSQFGPPSINDNESLVSSSIADYIRQSTTEINGH